MRFRSLRSVASEAPVSWLSCLVVMIPLEAKCFNMIFCRSGASIGVLPVGSLFWLFIPIIMEMDFSFNKTVVTFL